MPLTLVSKSFTDAYGNVSNVLKANAGDKVSVSLEFERTIFAKSSTSQVFTINPVDGTITRSQGSFITDGFIVGQLFYRLYKNSTGNLTASATFNITDVTDAKLVVTGLSGAIFDSPSDYTLYLWQTPQGLSAEFYMNFIDSSGSYTDNSLIDNEKTYFSGTVSALNTFTAFPQIGKKSGNFAISNFQFKKNTAVVATPYNSQRMFATFDMIVPNILFEDNFKGTECLNFGFKLIDRNQTLTITDASNTGYFEEGFNNDVSQLVANDTPNQTVNYNEETIIDFDFTASGTSINTIEFGACYIALDDNYNLNKLESQSDLLHLLKTGLVGLANVGTTYTSLGTNPYDVELTALTFTTVGLNRRYQGQLTFTPNTFETFIDAKEDGNRRFIFWVKVGNTNTVLYDNQLSFVEPVGVEFTPDFETFVNKAQNGDFSDFSTPLASTDINIHDDIAYISDFKLDLTKTNENVVVSVVVRDDINDQEFELEQTTFDFSAQDLNYYVNIENQINNSLPTLSAKRKAYLNKAGAIVANELPLRLYYSMLVRWEYWVQQLNAIPYFQSLGIEGKNWYEYINGYFKVYVKVTKLVNGVNDFHYNELPITNYDDSTITSDIELFDYPSLTALSAIKKGGDILIRATHTATTFYQLPTYGDITIEPKEGSPTFWINNVYDNDSNSPLKGLGGSKQLTTTYTASNVVRLECLLDTTKLTGKEYTVTSKISDDTDNVAPFEMTVRTTNAGTSGSNQFTLPLINGTYAMLVDWGDGTSDFISNYLSPLATHTYASSGDYLIRIYGDCYSLFFNNGGDRLKVIALNSWGDVAFNFVGHMFDGCANMVASYTDAPNFSNVTSLDSLFLNCTLFNGDVNTWDVSMITDLTETFRGTAFNKPINNWDVSNVTNLNGTFYGTPFNQTLNGWDISSVDTMTNTFLLATAFNQNLNSLDFSNVTNFTGCFQQATAFNHGGVAITWNISTNVSDSIIMNNTFRQCPNFNVDVTLNTSRVVSMVGMFRQCTIFNKSLNAWDVSNVTSIAEMFVSCINYNQPMNNWNTGNVTSMSQTFSGCSVFNQNLSSWNVSNVTSFNAMFNNTAVYNNGGVALTWTIKTTGTVNMGLMFRNTPVFNQSLPWNTIAVNDMNQMFQDADSFNNSSISSWNVSNVANFSNMFNSANVFNQPLASWTPTSATNMSNMFRFAQLFNQPLNAWGASLVNVTNMSGMFQSATNFNQDIGSWDIRNVTNFSNFMAGKLASNYSATNYDSLLIGWASRPVQPNLIYPSSNINFGSIKRTVASNSAKASLEASPNLWVFVDGGTI